jgi:hypothetical protein
MTWFGRALRDNVIKDLTINQPGGRSFYDAMDWSRIKIAIAYSR